MGLAPSIELPLEEEEAKLEKELQYSADRTQQHPFEGRGSLGSGAFGGSATPGAVQEVVGSSTVVRSPLRAEGESAAESPQSIVKLRSGEEVEESADSRGATLRDKRRREEYLLEQINKLEEYSRENSIIYKGGKIFDQRKRAEYGIKPVKGDQN